MLPTTGCDGPEAPSLPLAVLDGSLDAGPADHAASAATRSLHLLDGFTPWQPLRGSWAKGRLPDEAGLYRIRAAGADPLLYVGQTGSGTMTLPKRMGMLRGAFGPEMPYRDPHTVGPALWAERHRGGAEPEVSVLPLPGLGAPARKGLEALVIALHRQEHGASPAMNFGRMPQGYRMSSANNAGLVRRGLRARGGPSELRDLSHEAGLPPTGPLVGDVHGSGWLGLAWSDWIPLAEAILEAVGSLGLYAIRRRGEPLLTYVGEGRIADRLLAHQAKGVRPSHPQQEHFHDAGQLEARVVVTDLLVHQRLEVENDLIASHVLALGRVPWAQFLG